MKRESVAQFVILAAVILVLLPLFVAAATICSHFVFGMTGMSGAFDLGGVQAVGLAWSALAIVIIGALISLLVGEVTHA
jgi:hypothetical protein